jgi:hypothetical protein
VYVPFAVFFFLTPPFPFELANFWVGHASLHTLFTIIIIITTIRGRTGTSHHSVGGTAFLGLPFFLCLHYLISGGFFSFFFYSFILSGTGNGGINNGYQFLSGSFLSFSGHCLALGASQVAISLSILLNS